MASSTTISRRKITAQTKQLIANEKGKPVSEILLHADLRGILKFTDMGVRALAVPLNDKFRCVGVSITPDEAQVCKTVKDVRNLVWRKVPEVHK